MADFGRESRNILNFGFQKFKHKSSTSSRVVPRIKTPVVSLSLAVVSGFQQQHPKDATSSSAKISYSRNLFLLEKLPSAGRENVKVKLALV